MDNTNLPKLKSIINNMLKRTHLDFANEFLLDLGFFHDVWHELAEMTNDEFWLVVSRRVERSHGKASNLHVPVAEHNVQHGHKMLL